MTTIKKLREALMEVREWISDNPPLHSSSCAEALYQNDYNGIGSGDCFCGATKEWEKALASIEELDKLKPLSESEIEQLFYGHVHAFGEGRMSDFFAGVRAAEKRLLGEV